MRLFLIESKEDKQNFIDKFGQETYDLFMKSRDRLKNNKISTDIVWHTKYTSPEEMTNILTTLQQKVGGNRDLSGTDFTKKQIPGEYEYFGNIDGFEVYQPLDYVSSMALGVNTGWCTTGRYGHYGDPNFKPSEEAAEEHFDDYVDDGIIFYYLLNPKTMYGEYAIAKYPANNTDGIWTTWNGGVAKITTTNFEIFNAEDELDYESVQNFPDELFEMLGLVFSIRSYKDSITIDPEDIQGITLLAKQDIEKLPSGVVYTPPAPYLQNMFWLKTPGDANDTAYFYSAIDNDVGQSNVEIPLGVIPVLIVNRASLGIVEIGQPVRCLMGDFVYIGGNKILSEYPIGSCQFNRDEEKGNQFDGSYIKAKLEGWLKMCVDKGNMAQVKI